MVLPSLLFKSSVGRAVFTGSKRGCDARDSSMNTMRIVVILEGRPLSRQIGRHPEDNTIEIVSTNGPHHPLNERLRNADIRNGLDLVDFENAPIGKPAMKPKQRIRVSTQALWHVSAFSLLSLLRGR